MCVWIALPIFTNITVHPVLELADLGVESLTAEQELVGLPEGPRPPLVDFGVEVTGDGESEPPSIETSLLKSVEFAGD